MNLDHTAQEPDRGPDADRLGAARKAKNLLNGDQKELRLYGESRRKMGRRRALPTPMNAAGFSWRSRSRRVGIR